MGRAVIYDRTSVRDEPSMEEHLGRCRAWCTANDHEVVAEHTDLGISGFHDRVRPGWDAVKRMVERGECDVVVFFALSRIERSVLRTFQFAELCRQHDVAFASVTEQIDSGGPWGKVILAVLSAAAEIESLMKHERAILGRERNDREGLWSGGRLPFGWRVVGEGARKRLEVIEEQATLIRKSARRLLNGEVGLKTLAREWNAAGFRTSGGRRWSYGHVRQTLENPRHVPKILTESTHRVLLERFAGRRTGRREERCLLTGLLRCAKCAAPMTGRGDAYVCRATGTVHLSARRNYVDETVIAAVSERPPAEPVVVHDPSEPIVRQREEVLDRMRALGADLDLPETVLKARADALQAELDQLEIAIDEAKPPGYFAGLYERVESFEERGWLEAMIADLVLYPAPPGLNRWDPERVQITWR